MIYVSRLARRTKQLERATRVLLGNNAPSDRVKTLALLPGQRIEAIRTFRQESGLDVRDAMAVVDSLGATSK